MRVLEIFFSHSTFSYSYKINYGNFLDLIKYLTYYLEKILTYKVIYRYVIIMQLSTIPVSQARDETLCAAEGERSTQSSELMR